MSNFFSSDPHFFHDRPFILGPRGFNSAVEMTEVIIATWNSQMTAADTLYCLGDWVLGVGGDKAPTAKQLRDRLIVGRIVLLRGNHDPKLGGAFDAVFDEVHELLERKIDGHIFTMCHYSMRIWNNSHKGSLHVWGHSHGSATPWGRSMDVGVDTNHMRVYSAGEVIKRLTAIPVEQVDHHNGATT